MNRLAVFLGVVLLNVAPYSVASRDADDAGDSTTTKIVKSIPVTGANSFCGKNLFKFPAPFPADLQLVFMGQYDARPNALDAIPLTDANCLSDTILATTTDPGLVEQLGGDDADPRLKNRKLRDVPTYLGPDGVRRLIPRSSDTDGMFPPVKVGGKEDITLGEWIKAKGRMRVSCATDGEATINVEFHDLIPDSLYTLWGMYATVLPGQFERQLIPVPLGGVPNTISSDKRGYGSLERNINGCPLKPFSDGSELMMVILNYHADGSVYGGDPDIGAARSVFSLEDGVEFTSTHPAGILNQDQLIFPVRILEYQ